MSKPREKMRNIGISAHIDAGKTTFTERVLYYTKRIHKVSEVHDKEGAGATMDSMEMEKERGITINSAATNVKWRDHDVNIIDTPGHVDFTVEVERALRVLDGAILVLCGVGGVQSQTLTVDRQLKRYGVPRLCFINKLDRVGATPERVTTQIADRLSIDPVMMQLPIGLESQLKGVIDLLSMKAYYFEGEYGRQITEAPVPDDMQEHAQQKREEMIDTVSMYSDELAEAYLEGHDIPVDMIKAAIRRGTIDMQITPVFLGSAYKNIGVQSAMNGVIDYLPNPLEVSNDAIDLDNERKKVYLSCDANEPTVALAFKIEESPYGQLTYVRVYQGGIEKGSELVNTRTNKPERVGRLLKMHAATQEPIDRVEAGDIAAIFGIDCASGDTFCAKGFHYALSQMHVAVPVISLAVSATDKKSETNMAKALNRFSKEDPTFKYRIDPESNQTIISGMGELHLDVYIQRMKREYNVSLESGQPQVAYREAISQSASFDYTHKKQTGGAGQYARVAGVMEPTTEPYEFVDAIKGGVIPNEFIPSCDKGFRSCLDEGAVIGFPITGIKVTINDGNYHPVDSSDVAFQQAAQGAFRQAYNRAAPVILEPIMKVSVEGPPEFQGSIIGSITQRRGNIISTTQEGTILCVDSEVPLSEMFGYSTDLRSLTQGKCEFSMEFSKYEKVPKSLSEELIKQHQQKKNK
jgi:elongation factor G